MLKILIWLDYNKSKKIRVDLRATGQKPEGKRSRKQKKNDHNKNFARLRNFLNLQNFVGCENSQPVKFRTVAKLLPATATIHQFSTVHP